MKCQNKKNFAFFWINQLFNSDFGKKTIISTTGPPPVATLSATSPAPFALLLPTSGLLALAFANISIYPTGYQA